MVLRVCWSAAPFVPCAPVSSSIGNRTTPAAFGLGSDGAVMLLFLLLAAAFVLCRGRLDVRGDRSATTLGRVEANDPALRHMTLMARAFRGPNDEGSYCPAGVDALARLGTAIGKNTNLRRLHLYDGAMLTKIATGNAAFFEGLKRNTSIVKLMLLQCKLSDEIERGVMKEFVAKNSNLQTFGLYNCALALADGEEGTFISALVGCSNLTRISLGACNVKDSLLVEIAQSTGFRQLRELHLGSNTFGQTGCEALATLLRDPCCNLRWLDLSANDRINDGCAAILAHALEGNNALKGLDLLNCAVTRSGLRVFSRILCNTSSVEATFHSNHVLSDLVHGYLQGNLSSLLNLNRAANKNRVAAGKILLYHQHFSTKLFLNWDLKVPEWDAAKVLPLAINWFDRAGECIQSLVDDVDSRKLSTIFELARALPDMFGNCGKTDSMLVDRESGE